MQSPVERVEFFVTVVALFVSFILVACGVGFSRDALAWVGAAILLCALLYQVVTAPARIHSRAVSAAADAADLEAAIKYLDYQRSSLARIRKSLDETYDHDSDLYRDKIKEAVTMMATGPTVVGMLPALGVGYEAQLDAIGIDTTGGRWTDDRLHAALRAREAKCVEFIADLTRRLTATRSGSRT